MCGENELGSARQAEDNSKSARDLSQMAGTKSSQASSQGAKK